MLKSSVFYLVKQKKVLFLKKYDLGRSQYQNKKALFTDPIFSDGFGSTPKNSLVTQVPIKFGKL